jgi:hypothetical protein
MAVVTATILPKVEIRQPGGLATSGISSSINVDLPYGGAAFSVANGTGAGQIDTVWVDRRTLALSTPVTLDLTSLAAASTNTGAAAFVEILYYAIISNETADGGKTLTIGNAASVQFPGNWGGSTTTIAIKSGGFTHHYDPSTAGIAVGTNKNLKLDPGAATHDVTVILMGRSV